VSAAARLTIVCAMTAFALVLHLALAAPTLVPPLDPAPLRGREIMAASVGVVAGDALVLGAAWFTLQLFARGTLDPTATNFRRAAYGLGAAALVVPPLTAVLLARWARSGPAYGATWKALLLAMAGHAAALAAGVSASPHLWVVMPVQLVAVGLGTSLGLHWGARPRAPPARVQDVRSEPEAPRPPEPAALLGARQCAVG
jgi:hypothetical protein